MNYPLFTESSHTANYRLYRPTYPLKLYNFILEYYFQNTKEHSTNKIPLAVDVACGSGQATFDLASYCEKVIGIDGSQNQIENAIKKPNIEYRCGPAEDLSSFCSPNSVDLVTVATAIHYFDLEKFFKAVDRVLKPNGGVLAVWTYYIPSLENGSDEATRILQQFYNDELKDCWSDRHEIAAKFYTTILHLFPYAQTQVHKQVESKKEMTVRNFVSYCGTWSVCQCYKEKYGEEKLTQLLQQLATNLVKCYQNKNEEDLYETQITVVWEIHLYLMRKN